MNKIFIDNSNKQELVRSTIVNNILSQETNNYKLVDSADKADIILFINDINEKEIYAGKKYFIISNVQDLVDNREAVINKILSTENKLNIANFNTLSVPTIKNIVAVTACPTGVAHTFMSAEAIEKYAKDKGWQITVETRGQQGVGNPLTEQQIAQADLVFVATDIEVDLSKFSGKRMYRTTTGAALKKTAEEFDKAFENSFIYKNEDNSSYTQSNNKGILSHLLTGVSYMLPIVVAGGISIAISFAFGVEAFREKGSLAAALMDIGGGSAFAIMISIFSGFVAYSIADRPGLAPGLVGGFLASSLGLGFIGGIFTGLFAGYFTKYLNKSINLPNSISSMKPILVIPVLSVIITGLFTIYVLGYFSFINTALSDWLKTLSGTDGVILGLIIGLMMCFDLGGPVNKAAYATSLGLLADGVQGPIAIAMAAGMVPPIGMFFATIFAKSKFNKDQIASNKSTLILGACFISEGAIPFAAADPVRVIPSNLIGGGITGIIVGFLGITLTAPHGGIFVIYLTSNPVAYIGSILIGSLVTGIIYAIIKKKIN